MFSVDFDVLSGSSIPDDVAFPHTFETPALSAHAVTPPDALDEERAARRMKGAVDASSPVTP